MTIPGLRPDAYPHIEVEGAAGRMSRALPACVERGCGRPAVWTVQVDHAARAGLDVEFCDEHAFARVTQAATWGSDSSWGPVMHVELLRVWSGR